MQQVKVFYPGLYDVQAGVAGKPFIYLTDNTLAEVERRVTTDLFQVHDMLEKHADLNGQLFTVVDNSDRAQPHKVRVDLYVPYGDLPSVLGNQLSLKAVVEIWAQRSRVFGVRGDRFYAIECPDPNGFHSFTLIDPLDGREVVSTNKDGSARWDFDHDVILRTNLLIGTTVFYNERNVTIGFPNADEELVASIGNLVYHVTKEAPSSMGVIVTFNDAIEFRYGA